jgi:RecA/RadA recombinase
MSLVPKIIELRKILAERFPQERSTHLLTPTGWPPLDSLLGGGLPKGSITQLIVPHISAGGAIILHEIIEAMHEHSQCAALIDGKNSFEPFTDYPLLLWIRCQNAIQALKATDLVLRDSNLPFSILDFKQNSDTELSKIPGTTWHRFQRIIEENKSTLLTITRHPVVSSAQISISLTHQLSMDDLTSFRAEITELFSLRIARRRAQLEYQYA